MSWFVRDPIKPAVITTDAAGLVRLINHLHYDAGLSSISHGFEVSVRPYLGSEEGGNDWVTVFLDKYQTKALMKRLPQRSLAAIYGV